MGKKLLAVLLIVFTFAACGDDSKEEEVTPAVNEVAQDSLKTIEGEFIYLADAAVLKGKDFIYGVELDSVSMELVEKVEPLKRDEFDMIPVVVRAKIIQNPGPEGWDELAQIREIIRIPKKNVDSAKVPAQNNNEELD
ncbi:hypothetical protein [Salinimicrobium soli]